MPIEKDVAASAVQFTSDGAYLVEKGGIRSRIADPIQVAAFGTSEPGTVRELAYTAVRFVDREGKRKKEIVPSSMLVSQPGEFVALLAGRGYLWPPSQELRHKIVGELSIIKPTRRIRVTPVPGWHGQGLCAARRKLYATRAGPKAISTLLQSERSFGRISALGHSKGMERAGRKSLHSLQSSAIGCSRSVRRAEFAVA
jgi:hypothetical protein